LEQIAFWQKTAPWLVMLKWVTIAAFGLLLLYVEM
jgi:negative regulator of sigma E activity